MYLIIQKQGDDACKYKVIKLLKVYYFFVKDHFYRNYEGAEARRLVAVLRRSRVTLCWGGNCLHVQTRVMVQAICINFRHSDTLYRQTASIA